MDACSYQIGVKIHTILKDYEEYIHWPCKEPFFKPPLKE